MERRDFIKGMVASSLTGLIPMAGCSGLTRTSQNNRKRPNIVFLLTDDHRWDALGCINPMLKTPNLDAMAAEGVLFSNAYVTTAICCTSRASILTGQYARRHGINNFTRQFTDEQLANTYPLQLKQAGYQIAFVGKYGVGEKNMPAQAYDFWRAWPGQGKYEGHVDENGKPIHLTKVLGNQSLEFLDTCTVDKPFCLSVSFKAPHVQDEDPRQFIYDPEYKDLYKGVTFPPPHDGTEADWQRFPEFFKKDNEGRVRWQLLFSTPEKYQEMLRGYYRLIYGIDVQVGRIRQKLQEKGLDDNTIIIFMGDNGFFLGEHGLAHKWYPYEESIRVPLIIYDPRLPLAQRGNRCPEMALNIDVAPTILRYAGVSAPAIMQGLDLSRLVKGKSVSWRQDFFYEHLFEHKRIPKSEGVIGKRYKYIRWISEPVYEELLDLKVNPAETVNFASDPQYNDVLTDMRDRYQQLLAAAR